jgi:pimeloyl-ACP methyl ester carboxylesterase
MDALMKAAQQQVAAALGAQIVVAEHSKGNTIWVDEPEVVIQAIGDVVEAVRNPASWATPAADTPSPASGDFAGRIDIGNGRSLYLECHGEGGPTVVLEAGSGAFVADWGAVLPSGVASFTHVCAYDRANVPGGKSDPAPPGVITAVDVVADLHALLTNAGIPGPFVLVAHSAGGDFIWLYAAMHPREVAGLVFIDAPVGWNERFAALVPEVRAVQAGDGAERIDYFASDAQALASAAPPVPATAIAHGASEGLFPDGATHGMFPPDWPVAELEASWRATIESNAEALGARLVIAEQSNHFVYLDQPDLVIDAIRQVVEAARDPASWAPQAAQPAKIVIGLQPVSSTAARTAAVAPPTSSSTRS